MPSQQIRALLIEIEQIKQQGPSKRWNLREKVEELLLLCAALKEADIPNPATLASLKQIRLKEGQDDDGVVSEINRLLAPYLPSPKISPGVILGGILAGILAGALIAGIGILTGGVGWLVLGAIGAGLGAIAGTYKGATTGSLSKAIKTGFLFGFLPISIMAALIVTLATKGDVNGFSIFTCSSSRSANAPISPMAPSQNNKSSTSLIGRSITLVEASSHGSTGSAAPPLPAAISEASIVDAKPSQLNLPINGFNYSNYSQS